MPLGELLQPRRLSADSRKQPVGRAKAGLEPQSIVQAKHCVGRSVQPRERVAEQEMDIRPVRQSCRGLHGRLKGLGEALQPGEQFPEKPVRLALSPVDRDGLTQGGFGGIPLAEAKQSAGEMEVEAGVLRTCLEGCDEVCPGEIGPPFVAEQQPSHQIVVREKTSPKSRTRSQTTVGEVGKSLQQGQGFNWAAETAQAIDAVERWPQSIRPLGTHPFQERKRIGHPAGIHMGDREVE